MVVLALLELSPATPIADCLGNSETLQNFGWFQPDRIKGYDNEGMWFFHQFVLPTAFLIGICAVWNIPAAMDKFMESCSGLHPDLQAVCA